MTLAQFLCVSPLRIEAITVNYEVIPQIPLSDQQGCSDPEMSYGLKAVLVKLAHKPWVSGSSLIEFQSSAILGKENVSRLQ